MGGLILRVGHGGTRAAQLARLAVAAARRVEMLEAAVEAADVEAARAAATSRASSRWRPRDTRGDDARRARAVAFAGLERARRVQAAVAAELAGEGEAAA
jgi:hypothetical protein